MKLKEIWQTAKELLFGNEVMPGCLTWPIILCYGVWLVILQLEAKLKRWWLGQ